MGACLFFYKIIRAAFEGMYGARCPFVFQATPPDGWPASTQPTAVGDTAGIFGATETQNRGSLHLHFFVWLVRSWGPELAAEVLERAYSAAGV